MLTKPDVKELLSSPNEGVCRVSEMGRDLPVVTANEFPDSAKCDAVANGRNRPIAVLRSPLKLPLFIPMPTPSEASGRIVQTWKNGQRILWTYVPELPAHDVRHAMPWLTILRWEYNGSDSEGMPTAEDNQHMLMLDAALGKVERSGFCVECYRRIGAGLREIVLYIADRDEFLQEFNHCVANDRRYPITITFYKDDEWTELRGLIEDFRDAT